MKGCPGCDCNGFKRFGGRGSLVASTRTDMDMTARVLRKAMGCCITFCESRTEQEVCAYAWAISQLANDASQRP